MQPEYFQQLRGNPIRLLLHDYVVVRTKCGNVIGELVGYDFPRPGVFVLILEIDGVRLIVRDWYAILRY
jgi:hypothetical protein